MVAALPVGVFVVLDWFRTEYMIKKNFLASLFSYSGAMMLLIIAVVTFLIRTYQMDNSKKDRRRLRGKRK